MRLGRLVGSLFRTYLVLVVICVIDEQESRRIFLIRIADSFKGANPEEENEFVKLLLMPDTVSVFFHVFRLKDPDTQC